MNEIYGKLLKQNLIYYGLDKQIKNEQISEFLEDLHLLQGMLKANAYTSRDRKIIEQLDSIIEKYRNVRRNKE